MFERPRDGRHAFVFGFVFFVFVFLESVRVRRRLVPGRSGGVVSEILRSGKPESARAAQRSERVSSEELEELCLMRNSYRSRFVPRACPRRDVSPLSFQLLFVQFSSFYFPAKAYYYYYSPPRMTTRRDKEEEEQREK